MVALSTISIILTKSQSQNVPRLITTFTAPTLNPDCIKSGEWAKCPAYPNAICYDDYCHGCSAKFVNLVNGKQLSFAECNPRTLIFIPTLEIDTDTDSDNDNDTDVDILTEVDQYQKTRDNYGLNLNDEMIDIGRDLINYGDLEVAVDMPLHNILSSELNNDIETVDDALYPIPKIAEPCVQVGKCNSTTGDVIFGDDPVANKYTIDNLQKTRDNLGLNLNDEMVDIGPSCIGRDLINYGKLHMHIHVVPSDRGRDALVTDEESQVQLQQEYKVDTSKQVKNGFDNSEYVIAIK